MIVAVLLAAGAGSRFGGQKLLADVRGVPLIRRSAERLVHGDVGSLLVVVPPLSLELRDALDGLSASFATNDDPTRGVGTSIATGIAAVPWTANAALIALADQPLETQWISAVTSRYRQGDAQIVAPTFNGTPGHPVLFDKAVFPELAQLTGDRGAREVVLRDPGRTALLELGVPPARDVDTLADLRTMQGPP